MSFTLGELNALALSAIVESTQEKLNDETVQCVLISRRLLGFDAQGEPMFDIRFSSTIPNMESAPMLLQLAQAVAQLAQSDCTMHVSAPAASALN